ncbi:MG2 domain-containing protein [Ideonella sp.]|uniref:alpha-2-macroglobulin family protein n=1 Tax=Ideonella sp. TaxID=1929293 RepID=UPI002B469DC5|nr:MG2 domain-containing protein [Ideonella sp.]HJV68291.1 MG2 domain-containing protein [Ideonella sp.]
MNKIQHRAAQALSALVLTWALPASAGAFTVQTFSPQGETAQVRQARATFSEPMVRFGDPRLPAPFDVRCPTPGSGRWVDDKTWVFDFKQDVPAGSACSLSLKAGLQSLAGSAASGPGKFEFNTGGPVVVRAYPYAGGDGDTRIEEEQVFALLLNGAATPESIQRFGYCQASGLGERLPLQVVDGAVRDAILKAVNLQPQRARVATVRCARPLPNGAKVEIVWAKGIATPSGVPNSADRRLKYAVRPPFTASFTCERENARADCLPIRPLRLEFSSPVPRALAERVALVTPGGERLAPQVETGRGEQTEQLLSFWDRGMRRFLWLVGRSKGDAVDAEKAKAQEGVSAVQWKAALPESAALRIELPPELKDDAGRGLANASQFPLAVRTATAPPLAKFAAAPFGVLEWHDQPLLPVTLRHVEPDLVVKGANVTAASPPGQVRDLKLTDDAQIVAWLAKVHRYHENVLPRGAVEAELGIKLPPPPPKQKPARPAKRYGQDAGEGDGEGEEGEYGIDETRVVQTRAVSLLNTDKSARKLALPPTDAKDQRPFEVVGIPLPEAGLHIVEIESPRLGRSLLDRDAPMYVRTAALVTNLGVHFKWGAVNSGVWVTTLDKAQPVADAQVQVSDCRGEPKWQGRTNAQGFVQVDQELPPLPWGYCNRGDDEGSGENGYFVSARHLDAPTGKADLAFVWSTWNQGIEAWRFHVGYGGGRYGDQEARAQRMHTVLDRTLLRAGQVVSMKHYARVERLVGLGLATPDALPRTLRIVHQGSGQRFDFPLEWRDGRYAESRFEVPKDARLGEYDVLLIGARGLSLTTGAFRVEEFRLPVMTGRIVPPKGALISPAELPLNLQVNYGNGGGAAGLEVKVSAQLRPATGSLAQRAEAWPGFRFEPPRQPRDAEQRSFFEEDYVDEDDDERSIRPRGNADVRLVADKLATTLDKNGAGSVKLTQLPAVSNPSELVLQATYADPNGEIQSLTHSVPVWPSAVVLGVKTDRWVSVRQKLPTQVLALDTAGKPIAQQAVALRAVLHKVQSTRRRLVGGFYAYDNERADEDLGEVCNGKTDARGLLLCDVTLKEAGDIELIASATDAGGHTARAAANAWVTRQGELWFGGDNDDRMDVIPEQRAYEPGQTARLQVRMPFRHATALVAIERNGIIETRTVQLNGQDPTIELPVKAEWGPNVYVSVLAVRGRIREVPWYSFFQWGWKTPGEWWSQYRGADQLYQAPTAMVDLSKPAFKYGIAEIAVGIAGHRLKVDVSTDKSAYPIRANAQVKLKVTLPDGKPAPAGTEVAVAAVDEALLELMPNASWDLLGAMIRHRAYDVETATAQMQIIGKRHFGKKAAAPGGGGGAFPTRELFDTLLLWNPRVALDANGQATLTVPLNDSLTSFRIVAVADAVQGSNAALFGTGQASIRSTQDVQIVSGLPPLVREGDRYRASVTVRNTTATAMEVKVDAALSSSEGSQTLAAQELHIDAGGAQEAAWDVQVPYNAKSVDWTITAESVSGSAARDRMKLAQKVAEAVPVTVQQATLLQLDKAQPLSVAPPQTALRDERGALRGGIDIGLRPKLADGLPGVAEYLRRYAWTCLEQQASVAIGLREAGRWRGVMERLPLYLDDDGLANYFPPRAGSRSEGSDTLTAYLLSVSAEAGGEFAIPDESRARMEAALVAFVEGRLKRQFWVPAALRNGDLDVRKLAALEALSRSGKVQPRMLQSIQILPNQWPTAAVIDWLMVLDRTPGLPERDKHIAEAENILRARLNLQGTRMGFSTERDDNWWWLMANGDVNAVRLVLAVLQHPGWKDDMPRLVTGALQRQQFGHWSTTPANAWGVLAVEAFSRRFESEPVAGRTQAGFDGAKAQVLDWAATPQGGTLAMGWPVPRAGAASAPLSAGELKVTHEGSGRPWLTLVSKAAVPVVQPFSSGYRITKTVAPVEQKVKGAISRGDVYRITLQVDAQADMTWVVVNDPIPGGATLLGSGLGRDSALQTEGERRDDRGWLAYEERSFEAFRAYYRYLPKGPLTLEYTVRLNNPGDFGLPQTRVEAMYAPEMFGESPNARMVVKP